MKIKKYVKYILLVAVLTVLSACSKKEEDTFDKVYEAEDGKFTGNIHVESDKQGFSGTGYVTGLEEDADRCTLEIEVPKDGRYDLVVRSASCGGFKENIVNVDTNDNVGTFTVTSEEFSDSRLVGIYMVKGKHQVTIKKSWGWIYLDSIEVKDSEPASKQIYSVEDTLIDKKATTSTQNLMKYLVKNYGKAIISGQYADAGCGSTEFMAIKKASGKLPAMLGLDLIDYSPSRVSHGTNSKAAEHAISFDKLGGIVTFCWHWNAPDEYLVETEENPWWSGFYTKGTNIDLGKIMSGEDQEGYELLLSDIEMIAKQLKRLQDLDIPIIWRPLHEASGGWFWWGASGKEAYIKLWKLLYQQLTEVYDIHNLIWVWNGQNIDWYPGDEYVDIIGQDIYPGERIYTSQASKFFETVEYTKQHKIIAMTENGCLFDPDLAFRDEVIWSWFSTWQDDFVTKNGLNELSEQYTQAFMVNKVYNHEKVITLDELPDWKVNP